jgi:hypothetical protein
VDVLLYLPLNFQTCWGVYIYRYTDASESIRTTSFFGITFLCVDIFLPIFQVFAQYEYPHSQIVTGDLPLFVHKLDQEK